MTNMSFVINNQPRCLYSLAQSAGSTYPGAESESWHWHQLTQVDKILVIVQAVPIEELPRKMDVSTVKLPFIHLWDYAVKADFQSPDSVFDSRRGKNGLAERLSLDFYSCLTFWQAWQAPRGLLYEAYPKTCKIRRLFPWCIYAFAESKPTFLCFLGVRATQSQKGW